MTLPAWWTEDASAAVKIALAAAALALVGWDLARRRPGARAAAIPSDRWRATSTVAVGLLGFLAYFNFGAFHFDGVTLHLWDGLHHYLGAKYVDELRYDGLYECIALTDAEDPGLASIASSRVLTDLRTNRATTASDVIAHPERCRARFTAERWSDFRADVAFFRDRFPDADWQRLTTDHGFNASPVWVLLAHPLVGAAPVSMTRLQVLAAMDPLLMLAAVAALVWAFGWQRAALVALVWGTYFPGRLWWTGGSLLRWDWLAALLAGLSLLRRDRPVAAGVLLGYASLSRVFPAFALVGATLSLLVSALRRRPPDRAIVRLL
ncbi:MAG TPA: hypothetical protein VHU40_11425, partial [Polyangia bacterium]|nr:hypothetical protein [Polyangia bacterium]